MANIDPRAGTRPPVSDEARALVSRVLDGADPAALADEAGRLMRQARERQDDAIAAGLHTTVVYFARLGTRVKIGYTDQLAIRMGTLGVEEVLGVTAGGRHLERQLHERFAAQRVVGEWFEDCDEIRAYLAEHCP